MCAGRCPPYGQAEDEERNATDLGRQMAGLDQPESPERAVGPMPDHDMVVRLDTQGRGRLLQPSGYFDVRPGWLRITRRVIVQEVAV